MYLAVQGVCRHSDLGLALLAVEGKIDEPLGPTLGEECGAASDGVAERFAFLLDALGLTTPAPDSVHYQLLHRIRCALLAARESGVGEVVMVMRSFSRDAK